VKTSLPVNLKLLFNNIIMMEKDRLYNSEVIIWKELAYCLLLLVILISFVTQNSAPSADHGCPARFHPDVWSSRCRRDCAELLWLKEWHSPFELTEALGKWIDDYNMYYLHSTLEYKSPMKFEEEYINSQQTLLVIPWLRGVYYSDLD
jgi:hypothetical protein